jgi:hypothetical protein
MSRLPQPSPGKSRMDRRALLKRAAVGGGVAAAVWAAPRVEGMKLVPDYAAAGTNGAPVTTTVTINSNDRGADPGLYQTWADGVSGSTRQSETMAFGGGGSVTISMGGIVTPAPSTDDPGGNWSVDSLTIPPGCTSCEVALAALACPAGAATSDVVSPWVGLGVQNANCDGAYAAGPYPDSIAANFTVTCI